MRAIPDDLLFHTKRGGLGVLRTCRFCSHAELTRASAPGVGRGHGFRVGNQARGRLIQHVKSAHPVEYASAKARRLILDPR